MFNFGDIVVVDNVCIGVIVKCWDGTKGLNYDIYVRDYNTIKNYPHSAVHRYIYNKELCKEEIELMTNWKDISKKFDELKGLVTLEEDEAGEWSALFDAPRVKDFIHSTLDEYVRELLGEELEQQAHFANNMNYQVRVRNRYRQELLKQHEENMSK